MSARSSPACGGGQGGGRGQNRRRGHGKAPKTAAQAAFSRAIAASNAKRGCLNNRHELTDCVQTKLSCHHRHHMASKVRSCPLSFQPSSRGAAPDQVLCQSRPRRCRVWSHAIDQQLFVTQLDAQASSVRTLNEGEKRYEN